MIVFFVKSTQISDWKSKLENSTKMYNLVRLGKHNLLLKNDILIHLLLINVDGSSDFSKSAGQFLKIVLHILHSPYIIRNSSFYIRDFYFFHKSFRLYNNI